MAHLKLYKKTDLKGVVEEAERLSEHYKNDVDTMRTHLNYNIGLECDIGADSFILQVEARVRDIMQGRKVQNQTNIIGSWTITYPAELCTQEYVRDADGNVAFKDYPVIGPDGKPMYDAEGKAISEKRPKTYNRPIDTEHCKQFMRTSYDYICHRYGKDNVMAGFVHMDETTPHITVLVVPEAVSRKNGKRTVSSASLFSKKDLLQFHPEFQNFVDEHMPQDGPRCLVNNGRTKGNYTVEELKARTYDLMAFEKYKDAVSQLETINESITEKKLELKRLQKKYDHGKDIVRGLNGDIKDLKHRIKNKKTELATVELENKEMKNTHVKLTENLSQVFFQLQKALKDLDEVPEDVRSDYEALSDYCRGVKFKDGRSVFDRWHESSSRSRIKNDIYSKLQNLRSKHPEWFAGEEVVSVSAEMSDHVDEMY